MRQTMNHRTESDRTTDRSPRPTDTRRRTAAHPGHDPRAATGNGIGSDPTRETAPAGTDPAGGPGIAPASEDGRRDGRRDDRPREAAGYDAEEATVGGPDRHNATETDPSATATPPGRKAAARPADGHARPDTPPAAY
ncbi:hypothetical protein [Streptomyces sp. NPDC020983]|uniref:hypothetical protein n=1 Tax=Streptomyces sp. NPDC020983 TaxID=3365106 RepID=UPI0037A0A957